MLKSILSGAFCAVVLFASTANADLIAVQDFDGGTTEWTFTADPAAGSFSASDDEWDIVSSVGTGSGLTMDNNFWGHRDVQNGDNPRGGDAALTFAGVDISGFTSVVASFDYSVLGYDSNDDLFYELFFDGTGQGEIQIVDGVNGGAVTVSATFSEAISDTVSTLGLTVRVTQNGGSDWGGWDNFELNGTAVPEPSAFLFFGLVCGMVGLVGYGRKKLS